jgi:hypothetical protein
MKPLHFGAIPGSGPPHHWARRLTQSPELGCRLWLFLAQSAFGFMQPPASLLAGYGATVRKPLRSPTGDAARRLAFAPPVLPLSAMVCLVCISDGLEMKIVLASESQFRRRALDMLSLAYEIRHSLKQIPCLASTAQRPGCATNSGEEVCATQELGPAGVTRHAFVNCVTTKTMRKITK